MEKPNANFLHRSLLLTETFQQVVSNPQFPGDLGAADARLPGPRNSALFELRAKLYSRRHEHC